MMKRVNAKNYGKDNVMDNNNFEHSNSEDISVSNIFKNDIENQ